MVNHLMRQIVLRRDGNVAKVTGISDGWLLLDGSVDDSALPAEVLVIDLSLDDDEIRKLAYEFGIDPLTADKVPDLARKRMAQENYAFQVLQKIDHPNVENAYITILGINEAERYKVKVKPEKGSSTEMLLGEHDIRKFEQEGVLPVTSKAEFKVGDIVRLGTNELRDDRVVVLKAKTDKDWQILDPVSGDGDSIPLDTVMFPTSESVSAVIKDLMGERDNEIIRQGSLLKTIDSLKAEANVLHKQLEKVQEVQLSTELDTLQSQLDAEKKAHAFTKSKLNEAIEDGAAKDLRLRQMQNNPVPVSANGDGNHKPVECKIINKTGEADFEKLWAQGWTCEHIQSTHDSKVRTVWKRVNLPPTGGNGNAEAVRVSPDDDTDEITADINEVADAIYAPVDIAVPEPVEQTANRVTLGKYSRAILDHGIDKTREAMDAEVTLACKKARDANPFKDRPIIVFLPGTSVAVQS